MADEYTIVNGDSKYDALVADLKRQLEFTAEQAKEIAALKAEVEQQRRLVTSGLEQESILIDENAKLQEQAKRSFRAGRMDGEQEIKRLRAALETVRDGHRKVLQDSEAANWIDGILKGRTD